MSTSIPTPTKKHKPSVHGGILLWTDPATHVEEVLLVKGRTGIWSFPKGHSRRGETSWECASREIEEETGIWFTTPQSPPTKLSGGLYYRMELEKRIDEFVTDEREIEEVRWVPIESLTDLRVNKGVATYYTKRMKQLK